MFERSIGRAFLGTHLSVDIPASSGEESGNANLH
jgi:hypothetical protein